VFCNLGPLGSVWLGREGDRKGTGKGTGEAVCKQGDGGIKSKQKTSLREGCHIAFSDLHVFFF
jgi:hypothetical protein